MRSRCLPARDGGRGGDLRRRRSGPMAAMPLTLNSSADQSQQAGNVSGIRACAGTLNTRRLPCAMRTGTLTGRPAARSSWVVVEASRPQGRQE